MALPRMKISWCGCDLQIGKTLETFWKLSAFHATFFNFLGIGTKIVSIVSLVRILTIKILSLN